MYGHMKIMMDAVKAGIEEAGVAVEMYQVPETLPDEVLEKMHAKGLKDASIPVITHDKFEVLEAADGLIVGTPTRFGMPAAQIKTFWDATGALWMQGKLRGKTGGVVVSTAGQGGGQETTALTHLTQFAHHGMVFIPQGITAEMATDEVRGGSAYGPGTFANSDGSRLPTELELKLARDYGANFAAITHALATGRAALGK